MLYEYVDLKGICRFSPYIPYFSSKDDIDALSKCNTEEITPVFGCGPHSLGPCQVWQVVLKTR